MNEEYGFYSYKLSKPFKTKNELLTAEAEFEQKKANELKLKEERSERANEVITAYKKYLELRAKFVEDYGSWHMTLQSKDLPKPTLFNFSDFLEDFFN